jgi:hypothetical protein
MSGRAAREEGASTGGSGLPREIFCQLAVGVVPTVRN